MGDLTVSVVIPTWNSARYLPLTLEAVLGQSVPPHEVIVVDDGSDDDTPAVIESYLDQILYVRLDNSGGPARPRNVGVAMATGDLVAFCDSDDIFASNAVESATVAFLANPEIDFVWGDYDLIDSHGHVIRKNGMANYQEFRKYLQPTGQEVLSVLEAGMGYRSLLRGLFMGISSVVVRRSTLTKAGSFDETLRNSDDREMWLRLARLGACFAYQDSVRFYYRKHDLSVTSRGYRRIPSMISNFRRQIPFIDNKEDLDYVRKRIGYYRLEYAWGLRCNGHLEEAEAAYRLALEERWSWLGLRGLVITKVMKLAASRGFNGKFKSGKS